MILSKIDKGQLRANIFRHLDGIVMAPTAHALHQAGVMAYFEGGEEVEIKAIATRTNANEGYLNVALRMLCSQGWLKQRYVSGEDQIFYQITSRGEIALRYFSFYKEAVAFLPYAVKIPEYILNGFDTRAFVQLKQLFENYARRFGMPEAESDEEQEVQNQLLKHIEGLIVGPLTVGLGMNGLFNEYFSIAPFEVEEFTEHHDEVKAIVNFFTSIGWFTQKGTVYKFTPRGLFLARRAAAYGVTVSYLPTFTQIYELLFGNANVLRDRPASSPEIHVDRSMNVWGSGGAHSSYFKKVDEIILDLFNRPVHEQPKGFLDMGCGNGAFIEHIFKIIFRQTARGKILDEYPLFIVGADFNEAALRATRATLNHAGIWAKVVWGDIGQPELLAEELQKKYDLFLGDLLNVRSFLDHNRVYQPLAQASEQPSKSTGAFASRGARLNNRDVEANLAAHLGKWSPYVERFGLLVIELHTIAPELAAANIGKTAVTAYDATHGFSDQYILELACFLDAARQAGLTPNPAYQHKYPNSELATVSINLLKAI
ncbi:MAG: class I SAM-dependent methyltransferase [Rhodothermales bacterium]